MQHCFCECVYPASQLVGQLKLIPELCLNLIMFHLVYANWFLNGGEVAFKGRGRLWRGRPQDDLSPQFPALAPFLSLDRQKISVSAGDKKDPPCSANSRARFVGTEATHCATLLTWSPTMCTSFSFFLSANERVSRRHLMLGRQGGRQRVKSIPTESDKAENESTWWTGCLTGNALLLFPHRGHR